jgi:hypothetical protein
MAATKTDSQGYADFFTTTERGTKMHASSELRQWFLEWLDGDNWQFDDEAVAIAAHAPGDKTLKSSSA